MSELTNSQRGYLRRLANPLNPTVMIGKHGLTEAIVTKIDRELDAHELIKVRFLDFKDQREELTATMLQDVQAQLVALVGNVTILFRSHRDPEQRRIALPLD